MPSNRTQPSRPLAGASRVTFSMALASMATTLVDPVFGYLGVPGAVEQGEVVVFALVTAACTALGKWLRDLGYKRVVV